MPRQMPFARNKPCPCGSGRKFKHCCGRPRKELPPLVVEDEVVPTFTAKGDANG